MLGISIIWREKTESNLQDIFANNKETNIFLKVKPISYHGSYIKYFLILSGATIRLFEEEEDEEKGLDDSLSELLNSLSVGDLHPC